MYTRLGILDLVKSIQEKIEERTGCNCFDCVPKNAPSPFYFIEVKAVTPRNSKTMFRDLYTVWVHAISKPSDSRVEAYQLIQRLEEALTEDVPLPSPFELVMQTNNGVRTIKQDETKEFHAVCEFTFMVCYGFQCKV